MLTQNPLAPGTPDAYQLGVRHLERGERFLGTVCDEDLLARAEEVRQAFPSIAQQRGPAGGGFEQATGRAVAPGCHVGAGDIQSEPGGTKERGVTIGRHVLEKPDVGCPRKIRRIARAAQDETPRG